MTILEKIGEREVLAQLYRGGERMTNGEKLRQMSNEELACLIICPYDMIDGIDEPCTDRCVECCRHWLEQEVEDAEND